MGAHWLKIKMVNGGVYSLIATTFFTLRQNICSSIRCFTHQDFATSANKPTEANKQTDTQSIFWTCPSRQTLRQTNERGPNFGSIARTAFERVKKRTDCLFVLRVLGYNFHHVVALRLLGYHTHHMVASRWLRYHTHHVVALRWPPRQTHRQTEKNTIHTLDLAHPCMQVVERLAWMQELMRNTIHCLLVLISCKLEPTHTNVCVLTKARTQ